MGGFNFLVSEVYFLFRMECSGTLIIRNSLESQLNCPCSRIDQSTPAGRRLSLPTMRIYFLGQIMVPGMTITYYQVQFIGEVMGPLNYLINMLIKVTQNIPWIRHFWILDFLYHCFNLLNMLTSGFLPALISRYTYLLTISSSTLYFCILPQVNTLTHVVVSYFLNAGELQASVLKLQTGRQWDKFNLESYFICYI